MPVYIILYTYNTVALRIYTIYTIYGILYIYNIIYRTSRRVKGYIRKFEILIYSLGKRV